MHVVIRADGGPDIGYGQLIRTNALAEELLSREHEVSVASLKLRGTRPSQQSGSKSHYTIGSILTDSTW